MALDAKNSLKLEQAIVLLGKKFHSRVYGISHFYVNGINWYPGDKYYLTITCVGSAEYRDEDLERACYYGEEVGADQ